MIQRLTRLTTIATAVAAAASLPAGVLQEPIIVHAATPGDVGFIEWEQLAAVGSGGGSPYACTAEAKVNHGTSGAEAVAAAACTIVVDTLQYAWTWKEISTGQILAVFSGTVDSTATLSTSSQTSLGVDGDRSVKLCFASTLQGLTLKDKCTEVGNV